MSKNIDYNVQKSNLVEVDQEFLKLMVDLEAQIKPDSTPRSKMNFVLAALAMGLSFETARKLCYLTEMDLNTWLDIDGNREALERAAVKADAKLEFIAYRFAEVDPQIAIKVIKERDGRGRWEMPEALKGIKQKARKIREDEFDTLSKIIREHSTSGVTGK